MTAPAIQFTPAALATIIGSAKIRVVHPFVDPASNGRTRIRRGFQFGPEPVELAIAELDDEPIAQIEALIDIAAEDRLQVTLIVDGRKDRELQPDDLEVLRGMLGLIRSGLDLCPHCGRSIEASD